MIGVLAAYAAVGWMRRRHESTGSSEPLLFTETLRADPVGALLVFLAAAAMYAALLLGLWWVARRAASPAGGDDAAPSRFARAIEWAFGRWWRIAAVLAIAWSPLLIMRWPGAVNPDFALMVTEIAMTRSEFDGAFTPYDIYPIAYSLVPDGDLVWSNQHNAFLTLGYGLAAAASGVAFHSCIPAIAVLATTQCLFTLFALGRGLQVVGRFVERTPVKATALAVTLAGVMIPLWSMDLSKSPLFAAAFVWWLALLVERVLGSAARRLWVWEILAATTVMVVSAKFAIYIALVGAVLLLVRHGGRMAVVVGVIAPVVVLQLVLRGLIGAGLVIPDDPIEARAVQLQQIALTLREDPGALPPDDRAALERIFDADAMARVYVPENADPVKSSGLDDNGSYRWRTVQPADWDGFTGIWARLGARHPGLFVDAFLLKSDRYLDPAAEAYPWPPLQTIDWRVSYSLDLSGVNDGGRAALIGGLSVVHGTPLRHLLAPSAWTVLTILMCTAAILVRRRGALTLAVPVALQVAVALLAPLNGSGRYLLGTIYVAGLATLLLGARPAAAPSWDDGSVHGIRR